jgi:hypothetical protein
MVLRHSNLCPHETSTSGAKLYHLPTVPEPVESTELAAKRAVGRRKDRIGLVSGLCRNQDGLRTSEAKAYAQPEYTLEA